MIILNLSREHDFMATDVLFENKLIKTKYIEKTEHHRMPRNGFKALFWGSTLFFVIFCIFTFLPNLNLQLLHNTNEK